jgi:hypothetical protein
MCWLGARAFPAYRDALRWKAFPHRFALRLSGSPACAVCGWLLDGHKPDFDTLVERRRDPQQHGKRVAFIVRIFQTADCGCGGADLSCQFPLAQSGLGSQIVKPFCDLDVDEFPLVGSVLPGVLSEERVIRKTAVDPQHGRQGLRPVLSFNCCAVHPLGDNWLCCKHLRLKEKTVLAASQPPFLG